MTIYWNKMLVVVSLVAAIVLLGVFGKYLPAAVLSTLLGALGTALAMLLPPTEKAKTTIPPPPMPGAPDLPPPPKDPRPWSEVYVPVKQGPIPPAPDTTPEVPEAKR